MKIRRTVSLVLLFAMLVSLSACGGDAEAGTDTTTAASEDTTTAAEEFVYKFDRKFGGEEFSILNAGDIYSMRAELDREEATGDPLDDAMYNRCRLIEELLEIKITEDTGHVDGELANQQQKIIMAGEDVYDIMYIAKRDLYKFTQENYLYNLLDFSEFNFDKEWWISSYNDENSVGGKLYAAMGYSQLMIVDSIWCLFFNEDMMEDLSLDTPYDMVRDGTWTLDALEKYLSAGAYLNGADTFSWDNKSIYGISGSAEDKFLIGCGERTVEVKDGKLVITAGSERFYNVVERLAGILTQSDGKRYVDYKEGIKDGTAGNYVTMFETERSLFATMELSKTSRLRDKEWSYGIVPFPKYDENQENYYSNPFYATPGLAIPVTNQNPEDTAYIADVLTYVSHRDVWPIFREITLEQKGLRNDDSIEMLDVIINSSVPNLLTAYGITGPSITTVIRNNTGTAASALASVKDAMQTKIDEINGK